MKLFTRLCCLLTVVFTISTSNSQVTEGGLCHLTDTDLAMIEALRAAMAVVDLTVGPNDVATGIGLSVIDSSCLEGARAPYRAETIAAIQNSLNRAIEQATVCFTSLRIIEMPDVISVLRRTRFNCNNPEGDGLVASMRRTSRTYDSCGRGTSRFMAGAHRRYSMTLSAPAAGLPDKMNQTASTRLSTEELSSFFAHEAMHVLAMNNTDWHNDFDENVFTINGCEGRSRFEDRIYFTQAACFPDSDLGQAFYAEDGPYQCPGLCENALTHVDEAAQTIFAASTEPGSENVTAFGPSQVARPYPAAEAARICARIRESRGSTLR